MTPARLSALGGQQLATLWTHILPLRPAAAWLGVINVHLVEAPVIQSRQIPLSPHAECALASFAGKEAVSVAALHARLALAPRLIWRLLRDLEAGGLVVESSQAWSLTSEGSQALRGGMERRQEVVRRHFAFGDFAANGPPRFVHFEHDPAAVGSACHPLPWPPDVLPACIEMPPDWKMRHRFPIDIAALGPERAAKLEPWQRVVLHRSLRLPLLLVDGTEHVGYALTQDGSLADDDHPVLKFPSRPTMLEALGDAVQEPDSAAWHQAWLAACAQAGVVHAELDACRVAAQGMHLRVHAPAQLYDTLHDRTARDWWTLAGPGLLQRLVRIEVIYESGSETPKR
jgi:hypothetical protein